MKKNLLLLMLVCFSNFSISQTTNEILKKDLIKVIKMNGIEYQMKGYAEQISKMIPVEKQDSFLVEFETSINLLYEKIATAYLEIYNKEDIKEMMDYYDSPIGKKIQANSEKLYEKTKKETEDWGKGFQAMMMKYIQK